MPPPQHGEVPLSGATESPNVQASPGLLVGVSTSHLCVGLLLISKRQGAALQLTRRVVAAPIWLPFICISFPLAKWICRLMECVEN